MRSVAGILLVSVALLASGCGSAETRRAQPAEQLAPAPPIEAIDEPAPDTGVFNEPELRRQAPGVHVICFGDDAPPDPSDCKLTPELKAQGEKAEREFREATEPADGVKPRAIARLALEQRGPSTKATLVAWRARSGKLCTLLEVSDEKGGGGGGPGGPCVPERRNCGEICLEQSAEGDGPELVYLLAGTVSAAADELGIELIDGRTVRYPLVGPRVPEFPNVRVFMLDLGSRPHRRLELRAGERVLDEVEVPQREIDAQLCFREHPMRFPDNPTEQEMKDPNPALAECLRKTYPEDGND